MNDRSSQQNPEQPATQEFSPIPLPSGSARPIADPQSGTDAAMGGVRAKASIEYSAEHSGFAELEHGYIREQIQFADQKAALVFGAATALLAFLFGGGSSARWLKVLSTWAWSDVLALIAMVSLAVTDGLAIATVFPRLKGTKPGFLFFNAVAQHKDGGEYAEAVARLSPPMLTELRLRHCYELACICRRKYGALRKAFVVGAIALAVTLAYLMSTPGPTTSSENSSQVQSASHGK